VIDEAGVLAALGTVYDPELDEPITALRFVSACAVSRAGDVDVRLRLPTPQCAPNFAYLMASDARDAVRRLLGAGEVRVVLEDHYTGDEINAAVGRGDGFAGAFPGETEGDLDVRHARADLVHPARVLVAGRVGELDLGLLCPLSFLDVQVGAAQPGRADLHHDVERAGRLRLVDLVELERLVVRVQPRGLHAATSSIP